MIFDLLSCRSKVKEPLTIVWISKSSQIDVFPLTLLQAVQGIPFEPRMGQRSPPRRCRLLRRPLARMYCHNPPHLAFDCAGSHSNGIERRGGVKMRVGVWPDRFGTVRRATRRAESSDITCHRRGWWSSASRDAFDVRGPPGPHALHLDKHRHPALSSVVRECCRQGAVRVPGHCESGERSLSTGFGYGAGEWGAGGAPCFAQRSGGEFRTGGIWISSDGSRCRSMAHHSAPPLILCSFAHSSSMALPTLLPTS